MKIFKLFLIPIFVIAFVIFLTLDITDKDGISEADAQTTAPGPSGPSAITCVVDPNPAIQNPQRIGVNMSFWTTWGAEQYMRNVLMNPGFEGVVDRIIVIVTQANKTSFSDGKNLGQTDDHWVGATFEVRSGQSVGATGSITKSLKVGDGGYPQYFTDGETPPLAVNDVIMLSKSSDPSPVNQWWIPNNSLSSVTLDDDVRPDSKGTHSLLFSPTSSTPAQLNSYLDTIADRAGKLLQVKGPWRLSFWVKSEGSNPTLSLKFARLNGQPNFISQTINPTTEWQQINLDFNAVDNGIAATLQLQFVAQTAGTKVWLDDIELGPVQATNPLTPWRQDVIDMLKAMQPSYLRDWQGQLGDSYDNRIADVFSRKCWTGRLSGGDGGPSFGYSIPDFLELCTQVGANPWIVVPPNLTDAELDALGLFLGQNADKSRFSEVIVEFGNENWNWIFRSGGIPIPTAHGPVAARAFDRITANAGPNINIRKTINGQYWNVDLTNQFATTCPNYDCMAVGPYFFLTMDQSSTDIDNLNKVFANDTNMEDIYKKVSALNKTLAVYEVNLHTMSGNATAIERDPYVAGAVGGTALAKRLIYGLFNHASPQCVFCFAQFDARPFEVPGFTKLWGIVRDVSTTKRLRPTGLATTMMNQVINGTMHKIQPKAKKSSTGTTTLPTEASQLTMAAFRTQTGWSAAVVNGGPLVATVELQFPDDGRALPTTVRFLKFNTPFDSNEDSENVKIVSQNITGKKRSVTYSMPSYGFAIFTAASAATPTSTSTTTTASPTTTSSTTTSQPTDTSQPAAPADSTPSPATPPVSSPAPAATPSDSTTTPSPTPAPPPAPAPTPARYRFR